MFSISDLVAALQKQRQNAELQTLTAQTVIGGLEIMGKLEGGKTFRILVHVQPAASVAIEPEKPKRKAEKRQ